MSSRKLYCYVDETGQDTKGAFFLVAIVLKEQEHVESLQKKLEGIEKESKKKLLKWTKTPFEIRKNYLLQLTAIKDLKGSIFYSTYLETKTYIPLVSLSIAKAILARQKRDYTVRIIIDGLKKKEIENVREELKKLNVHYKKIRGMKDEQSVFLRLADAIAGFLRDHTERQSYTKSLFRRFNEAKVIIKV